MIHAIIVGLIKFIAGASAQWVGCEANSRQRVYFANHTSNLDGPVIWSALPKALRSKTRPIAAQDYWTTNAIRRFLSTRIFHAVLIERKKVTASNNPIHTILSAMGNQYSIIIFPEGGRSRGSEIGAFKSGIYHLAKIRPDLEFVPVYIDNMNRILPRGEIIPVPLLSCIRFGSPLQLKPDEHKVSFLERARAAVLALKS